MNFTELVKYVNAPGEWKRKPITDPTGFGARMQSGGSGIVTPNSEGKEYPEVEVEYAEIVLTEAQALDESYVELLVTDNLHLLSVERLEKYYVKPILKKLPDITDDEINQFLKHLYPYEYVKVVGNIVRFFQVTSKDLDIKVPVLEFNYEVFYGTKHYLYGFWYELGTNMFEMCSYLDNDTDTMYSLEIEISKAVDWFRDHGFDIDGLIKKQKAYNFYDYFKTNETN